MLLKDLGLTVQEILPGVGHRQIAPSPIPSRDPRSATTATGTRIGSGKSFGMGDRDAGHDVRITRFDPMPSSKYVLQ